MFLLKHYKKSLGVAKLTGDINYIPQSLDFGPNLTIDESLMNDEEAIAGKEGWNKDIEDCKKALAIRIQHQAGKNLNAIKNKHVKNIIKEMVKIGCIIAGITKIEKKLECSKSNRDVIAKSAIYNMFTSISWYEKLVNALNNTPNKKHQIRKLIANPNTTSELRLIETTLDETTEEDNNASNKKWTYYKHSNRDLYRNTSYNNILNNENDNNNEQTTNTSSTPPTDNRTVANPNNTASTSSTTTNENIDTSFQKCVEVEKQAEEVSYDNETSALPSALD